MVMGIYVIGVVKEALRSIKATEEKKNRRSSQLLDRQFNIGNRIWNALLDVAGKPELFDQMYRIELERDQQSDQRYWINFNLHSEGLEKSKRIFLIEVSLIRAVDPIHIYWEGHSYPLHFGATDGAVNEVITMLSRRIEHELAMIA